MGDPLKDFLEGGIPRFRNEVDSRGLDREAGIISKESFARKKGSLEMHVKS